ncbi:transcription repressor OFP6-like [Euphorbia lathyris]|uniref:transcription repressor OFP6-like n=1 Tax=Euphorbia lathyris TaxID=212925 RepID=UPI003313180B
MSSTNKKKLIFNTVAVDLGCGSCRKPLFSNIFHPKSKSKTTATATRYYNNHHYYSSSTSSSKTPLESSTTTTTTTASFSPTTDTPPPHKNRRSKTVRGLGRVGGESVAVEKDSDDPYLDFRHSMLQMILEKEIYSKDDLKELLNCFLQLNSPYHHGIIVRAFTEIWNGVYSIKSSSSSSSTAAGSGGFFSGGPSSQSPEMLHYYYGG